MKIAPKQRERGIALLIVLFMVAFLVAIVTANSNALSGLKREIKLVDQQQKTRWTEVKPNTNQVQQPTVQTTKP